MTPILRRTLTPMFVAVAWIIAIVTIAGGPQGGLEPLIAGIIGGAAFMLQSSAARTKDARIRRLKVPVAAGSAVVFLVLGIAASLAFDVEFMTRPLIATSELTVSIGSIASILVQIGLALAVLAVIAQASALLVDESEEP
jgi:hypothetical protein